MIKRIINLLEQRWIEPLIGIRQFLPVLKALPGYLRDWRKYESEGGGRLLLRESYPCFFDKTTVTAVPAHYYYQGVWAAQKIIEQKPACHFDIGSQLLFSGMLSAFLPVVFVDIRPVRSGLEGLMCSAGDILHLPFASDSIRSLSCLHVIEHIGLGRYGDMINPEGTQLAARELTRVLCPGGKLYISVPVGNPRTCFNAHRVHQPVQLVEYFQPLEILEYSFEDDGGIFHTKADYNKFDGISYGMGVFCFHKRLK